MYRDIKLVTTERRRNYLVSEPDYNRTKFFIEDLLAIKMKKTQVLMKKPIYLWLSVSNIRQIVMHEFWYDFIKPKYGENARLCYIYKDSFIANVETYDIYRDITEDVKTRFDNSNYEIDGPLPIGKIKSWLD